MAGLNVYNLFLKPDWTACKPVPLGITDVARSIWCGLSRGLCSDIRGIILEILIELLVAADHLAATRLCLAATKNKLYAEPYVYTHSKLEDMCITGSERIMFERVYGITCLLPRTYLSYLRGILSDKDLPRYGKFLRADIVYQALENITHPWVREKTLKYLELAGQGQK